MLLKLFNNFLISVKVSLGRGFFYMARLCQNSDYNCNVSSYDFLYRWTIILNVYQDLIFVAIRLATRLDYLSNDSIISGRKPLYILKACGAVFSFDLAGKTYKHKSESISMQSRRHWCYRSQNSTFLQKIWKF